MPALQSITFVLTKAGTNTYFLLDTWLHHKPLAVLFPCLRSHTTLPLARVATVLNFGLLLLPSWVPFVVVAGLPAVTCPDKRFLLGGIHLSTIAAYNLTKRKDDVVLSSA